MLTQLNKMKNHHVLKELGKGNNKIRMPLSVISLQWRTDEVNQLLLHNRTSHSQVSILDIHIKYGLPYYVTCPSMSTDPGYEAKPSTRVVGSRVPYEYWGRWHSFGKTYLICIIARVLANYSDSRTGILCQIEAVWVAAESGNLWSRALDTTHYYYNYQYFYIQWH